MGLPHELPRVFWYGGRGYCRLAFCESECMELAHRGNQCGAFLFSLLPGSTLPRHAFTGFLFCNQPYGLVAMEASETGGGRSQAGVEG